MTARQSDLRGPLAIVVGSEGQGLGPAVRRRADLFMRIPMKGVVGSLNAAVAGSILLFEALAQRDPNATPSTPPELSTPPDSTIDAPIEAETEAATPKPKARRAAAAGPVTPAPGDEPSEAVAPKRLTRAKAPVAESSPTEVRPSEVSDPDGSTDATPARRPRKAAASSAPVPSPDHTAPPAKRRRQATAASATPPPPDAAAAEADLLPTDGAIKPATKRKKRSPAD